MYEYEWFVSNSNAIITLIISIFSLVFSIYATYLVLRFRKELSFSEQIANIPAFLREQYVDRKIDSTPDGKKIKNLQDARNELSDEVANGETLQGIESKILDDKKRDWYNIYAYQASIGLQNIGLMILVGAIPLKLVLPEFSYIIVKDWYFCNKLVDKLRGEKPLTMKVKGLRSNKPIYYSRRHAEWLAYSAAIYLYEYWNFNKNDTAYLSKYLSILGEPSEMRNREQDLREKEPMLSRAASKEIQKFLNYKSWQVFREKIRGTHSTAKNKVNNKKS